jgi:hypothetical protein
MYRTPNISDFERNLDTIAREGEAEAGRQKLAIQSELAKHGHGRSSVVVSQVAAACEGIYEKMVEKAMRRIHDYVRLSALSVDELIAVARPKLEEAARMLRAKLPDAGFPGANVSLKECRSRMSRVLEDALSDIEIGSIGGEDVTTSSGPVFNFNNSSIGVVNTGHVKQIEVSVQHLHQTGKDDARDALKAMTEAIVDSPATEEVKGGLLEHVEFLGEQATTDPAKRKLGMIKSTMEALNQGAGVVTTIAGAVQAADPIMKSLFGI